MREDKSGDSEENKLSCVTGGESEGDCLASDGARRSRSSVGAGGGRFKLVCSVLAKHEITSMMYRSKWPAAGGAFVTQ